MNFLDPREPLFRGLLFFGESRQSKGFLKGTAGIVLGEELTDSALKILDKKRMGRYSVSQVAKRIRSVADRIGRVFSTKGGSVEDYQTGCNQSLVVTSLAGARLAPQL
jgi:hypothetical protein